VQLRKQEAEARRDLERILKLLEGTEEWRRGQKVLERIEVVLLERLPKPPTLPDMRPYLRAIVESERFVRWADERYIEEKTRPLPMRVAPFELRAPKEWPKRDLIEAVEEIFSREDAARRRVLILGDPGAGKTTALERLTLLYAQRALANNTPLPILVPLDLYKGQDSLIPLLVASLNEVGRLKLTEEQVELLLREADCLVMLDGINELGRWREEGVRLIRGFIGAYPHHRYAITCRTQVYHNEFEDIEALEIQELEDEDIHRYLQVHLGEEKGRSLYWRLDERLMGLARNPLMLRMIKDAGLSGELPRNRGELFRGFVHQVLWRERGKGSRIPGEVKEGALARLGYAMQEGRTLRRSGRELRRTFTAYLREEEYGWREVLDEVVLNGLLKRAGWEEYAFMHQAMQEYFAAVALSTGEVPQPDWRALAGDDWWAETIVLLCGIAENAFEEEILEAIFEAMHIGDISRLAADILSKVRTPLAIQFLINALNDNDVWVRRLAADALGDAKDPTAIQPLIESFYDNDVHVRLNAVDALHKIGELAREPLLEALHASAGHVYHHIALALGKLKEPRAVEALIEALRNGIEPVRAEAAYALGEIGEPIAVESLIKALYDTDEWVRYEAADALLKIGKPAIETLINALHDDKSIAEVLVKMGESAVKPLIGALKSSNWEVRRWAAHVLREIGDERALPELKRVMKEDKVPKVSEAAKEAVERIRQRRSG
jgi:HEAT repeat protein